MCFTMRLYYILEKYRPAVINCNIIKAILIKLNILQQTMWPSFDSGRESTSQPLACNNCEICRCPLLLIQRFLFRWCFIFSWSTACTAAEIWRISNKKGINGKYLCEQSQIYTDTCGWGLIIPGVPEKIIYLCWISYNIK